MEIKLRTLTHLWTGGVDGKVDRLHETGILGSLRWWYEAIVRGLGGKACDPSKGTCSFDPEKYRKSKATEERSRLRDAGLCDVCQVFGATGWQRRFRLEVEEVSVSSNSSIEDSIQADRKGRQRKQPTWYFPNKPKTGEFIIHLRQLFPDFSTKIIGGLIQFVSDWAALGAKSQMGFGVVKPVGNNRLDTQPFYNWVISAPESVRASDLPSLGDMFFARITPRQGSSFSEKETFNLKYDLRRLFEENKDLRHFIMGTVEGKREAAKIKISRPYKDKDGEIETDKNVIRVWGWIPERAAVYRNGWNREKVVGQIHDHLKTNYELEVWRELNSPRNTVAPDNSEKRSFLQSLLACEENE